MPRLRAVQVSALEAAHVHDYTNALDMDGIGGITLRRMQRLRGLTPTEAIALVIVVLVTVVTLACCCKRKAARCFACCGCTCCLEALEQASDDEDDDDGEEECDRSCVSSIHQQNRQANAETDTESEEEEDVVPYSDQDYDRELASLSSVAVHHGSAASTKQRQASESQRSAGDTRHRGKNRRIHRQQLYRVVEHKANEPWEPDLEQLLSTHDNALRRASSKERRPASEAPESRSTLYRARSAQTMHKKVAFTTHSMTNVRNASRHGAPSQTATQRQLDEVEMTARLRRTGNEMQRLPSQKQQPEEQRKSRTASGLAHEIADEQGDGEDGFVADVRESIVSNDDGSALEPEIESRIVNVIERKLTQPSVLQTDLQMPCQPLWIPTTELGEVGIEAIGCASDESDSDKEAALERHIEGVVERKLSKQSLSMSSGSGSPRHVDVAPKFTFGAEPAVDVGGAPPARKLRPVKSQLPGRMAASLEKKLRARATLQARSAPTTPSRRDRMFTDEESSMYRTAEIFGALRPRPLSRAPSRQASRDAALPETDLDHRDVVVEVVEDLEEAREASPETEEEEVRTVEDSTVENHSV